MTISFYIVTLSGYTQMVVPEKNGNTFKLGKERPCKLDNFHAREAGGKVYLQWFIKEVDETGFFIISRSDNERDFEMIGSKDDYPTETCTNLMYCFIDENPLGGVSYYQIMKVYKDGSYYYSDMESVVISLYYSNLIDDSNE